MVIKKALWSLKFQTFQTSKVVQSLSNLTSVVDDWLLIKNKACWHRVDNFLQGSISAWGAGNKYTLDATNYI